MDKKTIDRFREVIRDRRNFLKSWINNPENSKRIDDSIENTDNIDAVIHTHDKALADIDSEKFGICVECSQDVEIERLEIDFTTCVCLDHYSEEQKRRLEYDLELAAKIQRQLLPSKIPTLGNIDFAVYTDPAQIVSGDYFDFFPCNDGIMGLIVADVMGKGLSSSMLMSNLQASIRILGPEHRQLDRLVKRLNELFRYNIQLKSFISAFAGRIDTNVKTFQYCNAGHNPAIYRHNNSGITEFLKPTGPAVGLSSKSSYQSKELKYQPGDISVIYTDGLTEARNKNGEEFGLERLSEIIEYNSGKSANDLLKKIHRSVLEFAGKFTDDVTMMVIKF